MANSSSTAHLPNPIESLLKGEILSLYQDQQGEIHTHSRKTRCVLAGSFNPLHIGHIRMGQLVKDRYGIPVDYELSVTNVDKPMLTREVIEHRAGQFRNFAGLFLTQAPTFVQKAQLFPDCLFVIGVDTAIRILDPKYYNNNILLRDRSLDEIHLLGGSFLVCGRIVDGKFRTGLDLGIPLRYSGLFDFLTEADFREDISSTEIRNTKRSYQNKQKD